MPKKGPLNNLNLPSVDDLHLPPLDDSDLQPLDDLGLPRVEGGGVKSSGRLGACTGWDHWLQNCEIK
jgi:hypothetical protein